MVISGVAKIKINDLINDLYIVSSGGLANIFSKFLNYAVALLILLSLSLRCS